MFRQTTIFRIAINMPLHFHAFHIHMHPFAFVYDVDPPLRLACYEAAAWYLNAVSTWQVAGVATVVLRFENWRHDRCKTSSRCRWSLWGIAVWYSNAVSMWQAAGVETVALDGRSCGASQEMSSQGRGLQMWCLSSIRSHMRCSHETATTSYAHIDCRWWTRCAAHSSPFSI